VIRVLFAGDSAITVELGTDVSYEVSRRIFDIFQRLRTAPPPGFLAALPTLRSLTVQFDPLVTDDKSISAHVLALAERADEMRATASVRWRIPACYDRAFAPDLEGIAITAGTTAEALAELHAGQVYRVYMVGGFPGFPFMGDLPPPLQAPRLPSPRLALPAGSVAAAGRMTAIYPAATPGGWNLIGRTPVRLFDPKRENPALIGPGDEVKFFPIDMATFEQLEKQAAMGQVNKAEFRM
jgi:inhibitor of KinA